MRLRRTRVRCLFSLNGVSCSLILGAPVLQACDEAGGCTLSFPVGATGTQNNRNKTGSSSGPEPYHPYGPAVVATYLTSAFNLTSNLRLVIPVGVQLRATESWDHNCGGTNRKTCDGAGCLNSHPYYPP